jgi:hypothetical protein
MSQVEALPEAPDGISPSNPATTFSEVLGSLHQSGPYGARTLWRLKYWGQLERVIMGGHLFVGQVRPPVAAKAVEA